MHMAVWCGLCVCESGSSGGGAGVCGVWAVCVVVVVLVVVEVLVVVSRAHVLLLPLCAWVSACVFISFSFSLSRSLPISSSCLSISSLRLSLSPSLSLCAWATEPRSLASMDARVALWYSDLETRLHAGRWLADSRPKPASPMCNCESANRPSP